MTAWDTKDHKIMSLPKELPAGVGAKLEVKLAAAGEAAAGEAAA